MTVSQKWNHAIFHASWKNKLKPLEMGLSLLWEDYDDIAVFHDMLGIVLAEHPLPYSCSKFLQLLYFKVGSIFYKFANGDLQSPPPPWGTPPFNKWCH